MYKVNIYSFEIGKSNMGPEARGTENNIHGGILPLILYGAPAWKRILDNTSYKAKLIRIQRLINIRITKAYRKVSNEALCVIKGLTPINIKIEETAKYYECIKGYGNLIDQEMEAKYWTHPANLSYLQKDKRTVNTPYSFSQT